MKFRWCANEVNKAIVAQFGELWGVSTIEAHITPWIILP